MKMKANPGGFIAPENVIGRDEFIAELWQVLAQQSVLLLAERRIGKSSILNKIVKETQPTWLPLLKNVESITSVARFVMVIRDQLTPFLSKTEQGKSWLEKIQNLAAGGKVAGVEIPQAKQADWHDVLAELLNSVHQHQEQQVLLMWDEFPWMLQKIIKNEGHQAAGDLLDTLRHCRQSNANLRMLFTGSIGLHQVISTIRIAGYSNEPVNDMQVLSLDALAKDDAVDLANALIDGEGLTNRVNEQDIAGLCAMVDNVPYFIHHLIKSLRNGSGTPEHIVKAAIAGVDNNWQLEHYYTRLEDYYPEQWQKYALVLDAVAYSESSISRKQIHQALQAEPDAANDANLQDKNYQKQMLRHLIDDHYLVQNIDTAAYQFRYPLIKKWWCFYRD